MFPISSKLMGADNAVEAVGTQPASTTVEQEDYKEELSKNLSSAIKGYTTNLSHRSQFRRNEIAQVVQDSIKRTLDGLTEYDREKFILELNQGLGIKAADGQSNEDALKDYFSARNLRQVETIFNQPFSTVAANDNQETPEAQPEKLETQPELTALQEENRILKEQLAQLSQSQSSQKGEIESLRTKLDELTKTPQVTNNPKAPSTSKVDRGILFTLIQDRLKAIRLKSTVESRKNAAATAFEEIMSIHQKDSIIAAEKNVGQEGFLSTNVRSMKNRLSNISTTKKILLLGAGTGAVALAAGPLAAAGLLTYATVSNVAGKLDQYIPNRDYIAQQGMLSQQMVSKSVNTATHTQAKADYLRQTRANEGKLFAEFIERLKAKKMFVNSYTSEVDFKAELVRESIAFRRELIRAQENAKATMRKKTFRNIAIAGAITTIGFPMALAAAPGLAAGTLTLGAAALNATGGLATTFATVAMAAGETVGAVAASGLAGAAAVGATAVGAGYAVSKAMDSGSPQQAYSI